MSPCVRAGFVAHLVRRFRVRDGSLMEPSTGRPGFAELATQVGLGEVGTVLALEVSRSIRNNADWYRLPDLAGVTDGLSVRCPKFNLDGLRLHRVVVRSQPTFRWEVVASWRHVLLQAPCSRDGAVLSR